MVGRVVDSPWRDLRTGVLVRAFGLSLVFHFVVFAGAELGNRLGIWHLRLVPSWKVVARTLPLAQSLVETSPKDQTPIQVTQTETPLLFLRIEQASSVPPAAPSPAAKSRPEPPGKTAPAKAAAAKPPVAKPPPASLPAAIAINAPKLPPGDTPLQPKPTPAERPRALAKVELRAPASDLIPASLLEPPPLEPHERPAQMADPPPANPGLGVLSSTRAQVQPLRLKPQIQKATLQRRQYIQFSGDPRSLPFGSYDEAIIETIQQHWYEILDRRGYGHGRAGKVVLEFRMSADGRVSNLRVTENQVGEMQAQFCQKAVREPAPYAPWPAEMRRIIGAKYRSVRFTFCYTE